MSTKLFHAMAEPNFAIIAPGENFFLVNAPNLEQICARWGTLAKGLFIKDVINFLGSSVCKTSELAELVNVLSFKLKV